MASISYSASAQTAEKAPVGPLRVSFVFPMYNEKDNIATCVSMAHDVGQALFAQTEIIVVDDASTDGSGELAESLKPRFPELRVVHHRTNKKLGGALRSGFAAATLDWILYIDSDLPVDMWDVRRALPLLQEADVVIGYRIGRAEGFRRELMSFVYNRLIRATTGLRVRDVNFAFKLFPASLAKKTKLTSEGSFIDAELLIEARRAGLRIAELGLEYHERTAGVSTLASYRVVLKVLGEMSTYLLRRRRKGD
ncbi:MAG TPA: glycosyltransferase family 2 protein [Armatimonadota bacterium]|jgi:glycosyltransferase involved in cell wall biosynthesis